MIDAECTGCGAIFELENQEVPGALVCMCDGKDFKVAA